METTWNAVPCWHSYKLSGCKFDTKRDLGLTDVVTYLRNLPSVTVGTCYNVSNRWASAITRLKTCLTTTMSQARFLHVHKEWQTNWAWPILEISQSRFGKLVTNQVLNTKIPLQRKIHRYDRIFSEQATKMESHPSSAVP